MQADLRNFPPIEPFCIRWEAPLMLRDNELNPEDLKTKSGRSAKEPTDEEVLSIFPDVWPDGKPRNALRSHGELERAFKLHKFNKNGVVEWCNKLEEQGKIMVVRGQAHNQVLAGRPDPVAAFEQARPRAEKALAKLRRKNSRFDQFSILPGGQEN